MKIWMNGTLIDEEQCCISVLSHGLHYGTSAFEGIRAYDSGSDVVIFRMMDHLARLRRSAAALGVPVHYSDEDLRDAITTVVRENGLRCAYIRPLISIGPGSLSLNLSSADNQPVVVIAAWDWGSYFSADQGISLITGVGRRVSSQAQLRQAKVSGAYANAYVASAAAREKGADEALLLDESGFLAEASAANIFLVKNGILMTPTCRAALAGITRDTIMTLANHLGYDVQEGDLSVKSLHEADEVFLTGTACQVTPVTNVDGRTVNGGNVGDVTRQLQCSYLTAVHSSSSFVSNVCVGTDSFRAA